MKHQLILFVALLLIVACTSEDMSIGIRPTAQTEYGDLQDNDMSRMAEEQSIAYGHYLQTLELMGAQTRSNSSTDEMVYPDYYGGAYINNDNKLVMLLKRNVMTTRNSNDFFSQINDDVIINECAYSYNELQSIIDLICEKIQQNPLLVESIGIGVFGITNNLNRVFVCLHDTTSKNIKFFKENIVDSRAIIFNKSTPIENQLEYDSIHSRIVIPGDTTFTPPILHTYKMNCGEEIRALFSSRKYAIGSIGYRARDEFGDVGFVTTAHTLYDSVGNYANIIAHPVDTTVIIGETSLDEVIYYEEYSDAAFIRCTTDKSIEVDFTNQLKNYIINFRDTLSTEIFEPVEGYAIYMKGATSYPMTSSYSIGKVVSSSTKVAQIKYGRVMEVVDVIAASYVGRKGDSGGIVFALSKTNNSLNPYTYPQTVGIHKGTFTRNDSLLSIVIKAQDINQRLRLTRF